MLFHLSFVAQNPQRVANVLAELMEGEVQPFPAVQNAWIAFANDVSGTAIEVYPLETTLKQGSGEKAVTFGQTEKGTYPSSVHFALKTPLAEQDVLKIGKREKWRTVSCRRGDYFHVIELWIENEFLIELITPDKQPEAVAFHNSHTWAKAIGNRSC